MSAPLLWKHHQTPRREIARGWPVLIAGFVALLAIAKLAEIAVAHWFGTSATHGILAVRNVLLAIWGYGFGLGYQLARERPTLMAKIRVVIVVGAGYVLILFAIAPGLLRQPMRPWLSTIILLGGIWSLLFFGSISGIRGTGHREQPTTKARTKVKAGFILSGALIVILLAIAPGFLYQPLRPWLTAIILIGGIWSLIVILSIAGIRTYRKTSATPNPC